MPITWTAPASNHDMNESVNWDPNMIPGTNDTAIFDSNISTVNPIENSAPFSVSIFNFPSNASVFDFNFNNQPLTFNGAGITGANTDPTITVTNTDNGVFSGDLISFIGVTGTSGSAFITTSNSGTLRGAYSGVSMGPIGSNLHSVGAFAIANNGTITASNTGIDSANSTDQNGVSTTATSQLQFDQSFTAGNDVAISVSNSGTFSGMNTGTGIGDIVAVVNGSQFISSGAFLVGDNFSCELQNTGNDSSPGIGFSSTGQLNAAQMILQTTGTAGKNCTITVSNTGINSSQTTTFYDNIGYLNDQQFFAGTSFQADDNFSLTVNNTGTDTSSGYGGHQVAVINSNSGTTGNQILFKEGCILKDHATISATNSGSYSGTNTHVGSNVAGMNLQQIVIGNGTALGAYTFVAGDYLNLNASNNGLDSSHGTGGNAVGAVSSDQITLFNRVFLGNDADITITNTGDFSGNASTTYVNVGSIGGGQLNCVSSFLANDNFTLSVRNSGTNTGSGIGGYFIGDLINGQQVTFQDSFIIGDNASMTISNNGSNSSTTTYPNQVGSLMGYGKQLLAKNLFHVGDNFSLRVTNFGFDDSSGRGGNYVSFMNNNTHDTSGSQVHLANGGTLGDRALIRLSNSGTYEGVNTTLGNLTAVLSGQQFYSLNNFHAGNDFTLTVSNSGTDNASHQNSNSIATINSSQVQFDAPCVVSNNASFIVSNNGINNDTTGISNNIGVVYGSQLIFTESFTLGDGSIIQIGNQGTHTGLGNDISVGSLGIGGSSSGGSIGGQLECDDSFSTNDGLEITITNQGTNNGNSQSSYIGNLQNSQIYCTNSASTFNVGSNATINVSNRGTNTGSSTIYSFVGSVIAQAQFNGAFNATDNLNMTITNQGTSNGGSTINYVGYVAESQLYNPALAPFNVGSNATINVTNQGAGLGSYVGYIGAQVNLSGDFIASDNLLFTVTNNGIGTVASSQIIFDGDFTTGDNFALTATNSETGTVVSSQILFNGGFSSGSCGSISAINNNSGTLLTGIQFSSINTVSGGDVLINLTNSSLNIETGSGTDPFTISGLNGNVASSVTSTQHLIIGVADSCVESSIFDGSISGFAGMTLTKNGESSQTLSGSNTYTGGTILTAGILSITSDGSLGESSGALTFNGGTLETSETFSSNRPTTLSSTGAIQVKNGTWTLLAVVEGDGGLTKTGGGTLNLSNSNTYTGATLILDGILTLTGSGSINTSSSMNVTTGATFDVSAIPSGTTINNLSGGGIVNFGSQSINLISSSSTLFSGNLEGTNGLNKLGTATLTLAGANTYTGSTHVEAGTLFINGSITSNVLIEEGATLGGSGTITGNVVVNSLATLTHGSTLTIVGGVDNFGTMDLGDSVSEIMISDNLTFEPSSQLSILISNKGNSLVTVGGMTTINPGVAVELIADPTYNLVNHGFIFLSANSITGTFSTVTSTSILISPTLSYIGGNVIANFALTDISTFVSQANALSVGKALTKIFDSGNTEFNDLFLSLVPLDTAELTDALNKMQPALFKGLAISQENNAVKVQDSLGFRLEQELDKMHCFRMTKEEDCQKEKRPFHIWVDGFGDLLRQKSNFYAASSQTGYQTKSAGVVLGFDFNFAKYFYLGLLEGYTSSNVDWMQNQGSGDIHTGYTGAYFSFLSDLFYANASIIGGFSHYHTKRDITYSGVHEIAKNSHGGSQLLSHLDTGLNFGVKGISIRPFDSFDYICQRESGFKETGASVYNLKVKKTNAIMLRNELGLQLASCFCLENSRWTLSPKISWVREVRVEGSSYTAEFAGTDVPFSVTGYFPNRSLISPGVMLTGAMWKDRLTLDLYYNGEFGQQYSDHNYGGQIRFGF